jgi:hypothetical protein
MRKSAGLIAVWAALACRVMAGPDVLPSAGGGLSSSGDSHAWFVGPVGEEPRFAVFHVPPRGSGLAGDGAMNAAARLTESPEMLAAWDSSVVLAFRPAPAGFGQRLRRVLTVTVTRAPVGEGWRYDSGGRLAPLPSLPGEGDLLGLAGTPDGPVALLSGGESGPELLRLVEESWTPMPLPGGWKAPDPASFPLMVALPGGFGLVSPDGPEAGMWRGVVRKDENPSVEWSFGSLAFGPGAGPRPTGPMVCVRGRLAYPVRQSDGAVAIWEVDESSAYRIARVDGAGVGFAFMGLERDDRLLLAWPERSRSPGRSPDGDRPEAVKYEVREVSASTGRVLYSGPPVNRGPVTPSEFRMLALLLLGVMVLIVLFVLRPEAGRAPIALPAGMALSEPGRRIVAACLDLLPALILGSKATGVPLGDAVGLLGILNDSSGDAVALLAATVAIGFGHSTLGEWLFGRSVGKVLTGCAVVRVRLIRSADGTITPVAEKPTLWRAAVRNAVKWLAGPIALAGLNLPDRRHRGDVLAGTVVVVWAESQPESEDAGA